jgi:hypothetical protein
MREEHALRVFENGVVRRIVGLNKEDVTGGQRKLNNEEFHSVLHSSPNITRSIRL